MKDLAKDIMDIGGASIFMGATASVSAKIGGTSGAKGAAAMGTMAGFLPTMGAISGARTTIKMLKKFEV